MNTRSLFSSLLLVMAALQSECNATVITITTAQSPFAGSSLNQGWWSNSVSNTDSNTDYGIGVFGAADHRGFASFDFSGFTVNDTISSATVKIQRGDSAGLNDATETVGFRDVSTSAATLNANSSASAGIYSDLGTGTSYGDFVVPGDDLSTVVLDFNLSNAVANLNAAKGGFFSVGFFLNSQDGNQALFLNTAAFPISIEVTYTTSFASVPEPSVVGFLAVGCGTVLVRRFRRKLGTSNSQV